VVLPAQSLPPRHESLACDELFGLYVGRQVLSEGQMSLRRGLEEPHRAGLVRSRRRPLVDPGLPVVGVDVDQA